MPLNFADEIPDPKSKKKDDKGKAKPVVLAERKPGGPAPQHLETQVIPTVMRKVGDWKTGRLSQSMVESYLDRHTLVFDRELLGTLFQEADYKKEGSLDTRALTIAISGRFPKREHTAEWRRLTALLLGLPDLLLTEDVEAALRATQRPSGGTYNASSFWDQPPPALPPVRRRSAGNKSSSKVTAAAPSAEWQNTLNRTLAAELAAASGLGDSLGLGASFSSAPGSPMLSGLGLGHGLGTTTIRSGSAGDMGALGASSSGGGLVATTGGLKQASQIADEQRINMGLGAAASPSGTAARSTFGTARDFHDFSRGLEVLPQLAVDSGSGAGPGPGSYAESSGSRTATRLGEPRSPVRVWAATLPPSAISLPPSALRTLRETVRSTANTKQDFVRSFKPLDSNDLDLKKTLGQPMEQACSLARVEPVRDTKVLPGADYVQWGDYAGSCRTAPGKWHNGHPTALAQDTGEHKYPWS